MAAVTAPGPSDSAGTSDTARPTRRPALARLNPLATLAAPLPAIGVVVLARDLATPTAFLVLALVVVLIGAPLTRARVAGLAGLVLAVAPVTLSLALWTDPSRVEGTPLLLALGPIRLHEGALTIGAATALRFAAAFALALVPVLSTSGPDAVRAFVQHARLPYRVGYAALAAMRFVPRFRHELDLIRQAHRVRGTRSPRGPLAPFAPLARRLGYVIPLMAGAIRHAERVSLAMDARAFGAHPTRTERHPIPLRPHDTAFVLLAWVTTAALAVGVHLLT